MSSFRPRRHPAGLTRTEILAGLVVLVILIIVSLGPLHAYLEQRRIEHGIDSARAIGLLLSQYATDNNGVYPVGEGTPAMGKSEGIALNLLQNQFTPNTDIFTVGATPAYRGTDKDYADLKPENISWDFTAGATATTGITASTSDLLPVAFTTGELVAYPSPGRGLDLPISGQGPFGNKGVVVAYKGGNAVFIRALITGQTTLAPDFISRDCRAPGPYTQVRP
ncbi:MAG: hypothetical protein WDO13_10875 [Verrucomicrobiota bacterium]